MKKKAFPFAAVTWTITLAPLVVYAALCVFARGAVVARGLTTSETVVPLLMRASIGIITAALSTAVAFICTRLVSEETPERERDEFVSNFKVLTLMLTILFTLFSMFLVCKTILW